MFKSLTHTRLFEKFWQIAGGVSIRVKVLGIVLGVIVLLGVFVTLQMRATLYDTLIAELLEQGYSLSQHILEQAEALEPANDVAALRHLLLNRQEHYSDDNHNTLVDYFVLLAGDGTLITSTFADASAVPPVLLSGLTQDSSLSMHSVAGYYVIDGHNVLDLVTRHQHDGGEQQILRLGLSEANIDHTVDTVTLRLLSITLVMVAVGFAAAYFLTWVLTRPIFDLVAAARAVERGDLARRVPRWADDELGDLAEAFNAMTAALEVADHERTERDQMRAGYISGVINAQEAERQRIARELHDSIGQALTSMLISLKVAQQAADSAERERRLDTLRETVSRTLDEVRTLAWQLRPSALDDLGLVSALEHYIADYSQRYGIQADFTATGLWHGELAARLPHEMETALYRIIQEALTNIARHAQATTVSVFMDRRAASVRVIVEDNGKGFDPTAQDHAANGQGRVSLGLQGMRERAALFGGTLEIESRPGEGTTVIAELPLKAVD